MAQSTTDLSLFKSNDYNYTVTTITMRRIWVAVIISFAVLSTVEFVPEQCIGPKLSNTKCDWYIDCLEKVFNCGAKGYPVGYGNKYCVKFSSYKGFP